MRKFIIWSLALAALLLAAPAVYGQDSVPKSPPDGSKYQLTTIVDGFTRPLFVTHAGDQRLFILEQGGKISVFDKGSLLRKPFLDVSKLVSRSGNEQGLLGLAFDPHYATSAQFYINYTNVDGNTIVARYTTAEDNPNVADPTTAEQVLEVDQPYSNHNGGDVVFGPDGYLYIGMGDGGSAGDPKGNGQNPKALLGKILRLDVNSTQKPYGIPKDNPFVKNARYAPEIWAIGLRNPWRFSFDRATNDLYIADVGQNAWEEVNFQPASSKGGENYGWNYYEGTHKYSKQDPPTDDMVLPFTEYGHDQGCSITGGYVYRGAKLPELRGVYFYGDYCTGIIWSSYRDSGGKWQTNIFMKTNLTISSFGEDVNGELYVVNHGGSVTRLEAAK